MTRFSGDHRSRRQKLQDMANQTASPHEAEVARRKLAEIGDEPPKPARSSSSSFLFSRRGRCSRCGNTTWINGEWSKSPLCDSCNQSMPHDEFMEWMRKEMKTEEIG